MHELLTKYPIISNQVGRSEVAVILRELGQVIKDGTQGDVVEFGCYVGTASLFLQRLLKASSPDKILHVYDSFAGLPAKTVKDYSPAGEQFTKGELVADKAELIKYFRQAGLHLPVIHKAWFDKLTPIDIPSAIAFAFLDGDFYESIRVSLHLIWTHLVPGACVIVDDYSSTALPGARRAVDEWLRDHSAKIRVEASLAIITPFV